MGAEMDFAKVFPEAPARVFLVGIGGIGMSGLAQLLAWRGYEVAGSDRGLGDPAKAELYRQLRGQGIRLYPQDGSGPREFAPKALVLSAAIEPGNADLAAAAGVPLVHRALAMARVFAGLGIPQIAIAGSCGKTSVTGWTASALKALGHGVVMLNGGYTLDFEDAAHPGNFHADAKPEFIVAEIDESDHSIGECHPDYAAVLNVGDDHYGRDELTRVFSAFLARARRGAAAPESLAALLPAGGVATQCYTEAAPGYAARADGIVFEAAPGVQARSTQSGRHSAWNGAAVLALLRLALPETPTAELAAALAAFRGVRQRFEVIEGACPVVNDYAHNPEKIAAAVAAARERFGGPLGIVFQPHGYGPLGFMREALLEHLQKCLQAGDRFLFLPVFYAGGTTSFKPTSEELASEYAAAGLPVSAVADRAQAAAELRGVEGARAWLVLGARDASLRSWSYELAKEGRR